MKALLCRAFGPLDGLSIEDVPSPWMGPGQVRIDVKAAALNYPDALIVQGLYQVKPPLPFVPGAEFAGVVSGVGAEVTRFRVGDPVVAFGIGGFAEEAVVDAAAVMPLPAGMDPVEGAAFFLTYCTSLRGLKDCGRLRSGEVLLVLGAAGGVGIAAVELGKALGATVIAAASGPEKLALCRERGADYLVDYATEQLRNRCDDITGRKGLDVVYDPVGGLYTEQAFRSLGWRGRHVVVGFASGTIPSIPANLALLKERSLIGVYWGESIARAPDEHAANVRQLLEWFAAGKVRPVITERLPFSGLVDALQRMQSRQIMGKVVVLPEP
jgi:NADPH:quinone reductase